MCSTCLGQYTDGFTWRQSSDYTPGTIEGSTLGNPDGDAQGNPVWAYEWTTGGALGSANPWYRNARSLMEWDAVWFGDPNCCRGWSRAQNTNPRIAGNFMQHALLNSWAAGMPVVRWICPLAAPRRVSLRGDLVFRWPHNGFAPLDMEYAIAHVSGASGAVTLLRSDRVIKPTPTATPENATVPLNLGPIAVEHSDSILVTFRADYSTTSNSHWYWCNPAFDIILEPCASISGPENASVCPSGPASFSVAAAAPEPVMYRWQHEGPPATWTDLTDGSTSGLGTVAGAASATLTLSDLGPIAPGDYRCVVTNACGSVTSSPATLTICRADWNCSGTVNSGDVTGYLNAWFGDLANGTSTSEFDGNPGVTSGDVTAFLNAWFAALGAGC